MQTESDTVTKRHKYHAKRKSLSKQVMVILAVGFMLIFTGGIICAVMLELFNVNYLYKRTDELLSNYISEFDTRIDNYDKLTYSIVTSDQIQQSGSYLIENRDGAGTSTYQWQKEQTSIINDIQGYASSDDSVMCAGFIDDQKSYKTIAIRDYYSLNASQIKQIVNKAHQAEGNLVYIDGTRITGSSDILLAARQIREKKNLTLTNIGTAILFIDISKVAVPLLENYDGVCIIQNQTCGISFCINDKEGLITDTDFERPGDNSYRIRKIGKNRYFEVSYVSGNGFEYLFLMPYSILFADLYRVFIVYISVFIAFGIAAFVYCLRLTKSVTHEIQNFSEKISKLRLNKTVLLPKIVEENVKNEDIFVLQNQFNTMSDRINILVKDNYTKQLLIQETKLKALQSQINPHFLYNTLNSVYWMTKTAGITKAADMVSSLGTILHESINTKDDIVVINKELDILKQYLTIQKIRYEERLQVVIDEIPECEDYIIPKFSLQPMVENAISYGLDRILETCTIVIRIFVERDSCICQVRNNGPAPAADIVRKLRDGEIKPKGNGIGLLNIDQRIKFTFGSNFGVSIYRAANETVSQITMKRMTMDEYIEFKTSGRGESEKANLE